ncbi:MAG: PD-(D/E)XK motif protein [Romboutsia sp.]
MNNLSIKFEDGKENGTYKRIDENHNLDIFIGYNNNKPTMILIEYGEILNIESSKYIEVNVHKRVDSKIVISFSLLDKSMYQLFLRLCNDIIESSRGMDESISIKFVINRWNSWRRMFKKSIQGLLGEMEIKGLLGELIFLKEYMIPNYGEKKAIESWMGPSKAHKDFEIDEIWYEVKSLASGSLTVKISSVEQLDSIYEGKLILVVLDKSTNSIENYISINKYVDELENYIDDFDLRLQLRYKLNEIGYYPDTIYDNYIYKHINTKMYLVEGNFPKINKNNLPEGIVKVSYDIELSFIEKYSIWEGRNEITTV